MQRNKPGVNTSTLTIEKRATSDDVEARQVQSPFPPEITEHPGWKAIWRKLLTPRTDPSGDEAASS